MNKFSLSGQVNGILKACIVRYVDDLDMTMYRKALQAQREYLHSRNEQI